MADVRMTASERAWLSWGRSGGPVAGGRRRVRPPIPSRHPAAGWLADELERVLAGSGGLGLVYQPIFDLDTEKVHGVEVLARLSRVPQLPASMWLAQADAMWLGMHVQLTVVRRVLTDLARVPSPLSVSMHMSATSVADARLVPLVRTAGPDACRLVIDLAPDGRTGWAALQEPVAKLRRFGVRFAVNDAVVRELPGLLPDVIKLDPSVVRSIDREPLNQALASALMLVADDLRADVCAEEIETAEELRFLRELGVQRGHGIHLGRPARLPWTIGALVGHPSAGVLQN
jgi:EAL domain-containing protein (putative c-di-GMP-specific phosphodiesterase class I)